MNNKNRNGNIMILFPCRRDENKKPLCRYCGGQIPKGRRWWCSEACVDKALVICHPDHAARKTFERDQYRCQDCGMEASKYYRNPLWGHDRDELKSSGYNTKQSLIECHHVVAVKDGGGECDLRNLVTLCQICHRKRHHKEAASNINNMELFE